MNLVGIYRKWSENRFLKKHKCETWEDYNRKYDPDVYHLALEIKNFYHGYPHVYCFDNHNHSIYDWDIAYDGVYVATNWCKQNLKHKFRFDFHRVWRSSATGNEWSINDIGGGDHIFFACKDSTDYMMFLLKWA